MRVKVEWHSSALAYLGGLSDDEKSDLMAQLERVREAPLARSDPHIEQIVSPYALRRFEFGVGVAKIAIFEYDAARSRMRVLKCRLRKPRKLRKPRPGSADPGGA